MMDHDRIWKHDVFLSFRGEDTRKTFTDHLYEALTRAKIRTFRDNGNLLQRGRAISFELLRAIEESRISIVIFSKNYGNSSWCLEELVKILDCMKNKGQLVVPLFYNVDPSDVRNLRGSFGEAFEQLVSNSVNNGDEGANKWRLAIFEAASLAGWDLRTDADGYEYKLIKKVVREVEIRITNDKIVELEEEEAKLKEDEEANHEKMKDLKKQLEAINLEAEILCSRRANLVTNRLSLEEIRKRIGRDENLRLQIQ